MSSSPPFVDPETYELDMGQIWSEAYPLAGLVILFGALALVPFLFVFLLGGRSGLGALFVLVTQFVLAVGTGVVLMYIVARGIQLAED